MTFEATIRHLSPKDQVIETLLWRGFAVEPYLDGLLLHKQSHDQDCSAPLRFGQPFVLFRLRVCMVRMSVGGGVGLGFGS